MFYSESYNYENTDYFKIESITLNGAFANKLLVLMCWLVIYGLSTLLGYLVQILCYIWFRVEVARISCCNDELRYN